MKSAPPEPDVMLAHVRVLRLTDKLLDAADELRQARDEFQAIIERPTVNSSPTNSETVVVNAH